MKVKKKAVLIIISLILLGALIYLSYNLFHYRFYNKYKDYLSEYTYETGGKFVELSESKTDIENMVLVSENNYLKLYTNTETAEIAIYDKRNSEVVFSNPLNSDNDSVASMSNKNFLKSQIIVEFFNKKRTLNIYDSYSMAVARGQIKAESINNGIRYIYEIGDNSTQTGIVPIYITQECLDGIIKNLNKTEAKYIDTRYKKSDKVSGYLELNKASKKGKSTLRKLNKYFEVAGFTQDMYYEQMEGSGVEGAVPLTFEIPLEYRLTDDCVDVSIPMSAVKENGGGKIYRIQMLRYFGAASDKEDGYMVVPNGCGSLINFNNGKNGTNVSSYVQYLYGIDLLNADFTKRENVNNAKIPLFGICRDSSSILTTIEDGASLSYITADVSGKYSSYNNVYPSFVLRSYEKLSMFGSNGSEADVPIVEDNFYDVNLKVKYTMLTQKNKGYSGIANYFRNRLINEGVLVKKEKNTDIPYYYDVIGAGKKKDSFLGKKYLSVNTVTKFNQAEKMSDSLLNSGIANQVMNFQGWFNGGYYHDVADDINVIRKLGGKDGLEDLSKTLEENGGHFYADVAFQKVTYISKKYNYKKENSRYYGSGYATGFGEVNPANLRQTSSLGYKELMYNLLSPKFLPRYIDKFSDDLEKYDFSGVSLRDLGNKLHSDKKRTNVINREEALDVVVSQVEKLQNTDKKLMFNEANNYVFKYAQDIINVPMTDNDYNIINEQIPLYQMIIHGCIDYSSNLLNLGDTTDKNDLILKLIDTATSPHFVFTWDGSNDLKYTGLMKYYATDFNSWKDYSIEIYNNVNSVLKNVSSETIINRETINGVSKTTYSNGVVIYINTTNKDIDVDGKTICSASFKVEGVK